MHMDEDCCQPIGIIDRITAQHTAQRAITRLLQCGPAGAPSANVSGHV